MALTQRLLFFREFFVGSLLVLILIFPGQNFAQVIGNQLLNVTVTDGISSTPLANQDVTVYRRDADGSLKWFRRVPTDANGKLSLDLPGLGGTTSYVLQTAMKHGNRTANSNNINQTGNLTFKVGNARVKAVNGQNGSVLSGQQINVHKILVDGTDVYFNNTSTDANGLVDFDLPNLGSGQAYVFKAKNAFDNSWKTSEPISQSGLTTFIVGNQLLNVSVTDGISSTPLANQDVTVYRRDADGSLKWFRRVPTDANGKLSLDLPGLGSTTSYVLQTAMKHGNRTANSNNINQTGNLTFKVGNARVKAVNGQNGSVLSGQQINVHKILVDGTDVYFNNTSTDANGLVDFDLPNLGSGQAYVFKAKNAFDNSWKTSEPISQSGLTTFIVGNQLLNVSVTDGISSTPLANQDVTVYRRDADGSLKWFRRVPTDANGKLSLDLPGLGSTTSYVLQTAMKHGNRTANSNNINQTGNLTFKVGNARVKAVNGQNGSVLSGQQINVHKILVDGTDVYFNNTSTDANGLVDFDLPNLGSGQAYVFKAKNAFDNSWKTSEPISQSGLTTFIVGNQLLNVSVTDGISSTPLANQDVTVYRRDADGSFKWFRRVPTDANGKLSLDLPGLGGTTSYVLQTAMKHGNRTANSNNINQTGNLTFKVGNARVKAVNGQNGSVLSGQQINVHKILVDGTDVYFNNTSTDANGLVDFDLPNLGSGQAYVFKAKNAFDNSWKTSEPISQSGLTTFIVGNQLLNVSVTDGISSTPLANQDVTVYRRDADGSLKWFRRVPTDANGKLSLDLPGLGSTTTYVLRTQQLYGAGSIDSIAISKPGDFEFKIGNLLVKAVDGATNNPLVNHDITVMEELVDGSLLWFARGHTNQNGTISLHLPELGQGRKYVLRAQTKLDAAWVNSQLIVNAGKVDFTVGNRLLNVQILNALDSKVLPNVDVTVYERLPDQSLRWIQRKSTDTQGRIDFDLIGLGQGSSYTLRASPYGSAIESKDIEKTGSFQLLAGSVAVKLHKAKTSEPMPGNNLVLFEKGADGKLIWRASLLTDSAGVVRFDPTGLGDGRLFVVRANNLFGNGKNHFSRWIANKGFVDFAVDPEDSSELDEKPPVFVAFYPTDNANLASKGFQLRMKITDNQAVDKVELTVTDPVAGVANGTANQSQGDWVFTVTQTMLTAGQSVTVKAVAYDKVGNSVAVSKHYPIINDTTMPEITVSSHRSGDQIDEHGLALLGSVSDDTGVKSLRATVTDPVKGVIENNRELEVSTNGHWGLAVKNLSRGSNVTVTLSAEDWAGNKMIKELLLPVMTEPVSAAQLLNRITFGASPELITELRYLGAEAFMQRQLHPNLIDNSAFESYLAAVLTQAPTNPGRLKYMQIAHATHSKRQLLEVMTWFWENHFNTDRTKTTNDYELAESQGFRTHALGRFRDLLEVSAKSPAMLVYLDNHHSLKTAPNENYARELLELHTLGVDNGYTSKDIAEVARVFTGWRVTNGVFGFATWAHDNGEKSVLGTTIPAGTGLLGGEQVLDMLAANQGTAKHICTELLKLLVTDQPAVSSIANCANDFISYAEQDDQIARVLEGILRSSAFSDSANFHNKVKIPLEFVSEFFRQFPVSISYEGTFNQLRDMGMDLYFYPEPTGWPEEADRWVSSGQLVQRWQFTGQALMSTPSIWRNYWEQPAQFFIDKGLETSEGVLAFLFELTLNHDYRVEEYEAAKALLTANNSERFDIYDAKADAKLRKVIAMVLNFPAYQLQ